MISEADDSSMWRLSRAPRRLSTPRATLRPSLRTWLAGSIGAPTSTERMPLALTNGRDRALLGLDGVEARHVGGLVLAERVAVARALRGVVAAGHLAVGAPGDDPPERAHVAAGAGDLDEQPHPGALGGGVVAGVRRWPRPARPGPRPARRCRRPAPRGRPWCGRWCRCRRSPRARRSRTGPRASRRGRRRRATRSVPRTVKSTVSAVPTCDAARWVRRCTGADEPPVARFLTRALARPTAERT